MFTENVKNVFYRKNSEYIRRSNFELEVKISTENWAEYYSMSSYNFRLLLFMNIEYSNIQELCRTAL